MTIQEYVIKECSKTFTVLHEGRLVEVGHEKIVNRAKRGAKHVGFRGLGARVTVR